MLEYNPQTGKFTWLEDRGAMKVKGKVAGTVDKDGYTVIRIGGRGYKAHRLAFQYMGKEIPEQVDHINGDPSDNRWCNLRGCTATENAHNQRKPKNNTSGYRNIHWRPERNSWVVRYHGRKHFKTLESAVEHLRTLRLQHCGQFAYLEDLEAHY